MKIITISLSLILTTLASCKQKPLLVIVEKNSAWKNITISGIKHWEGYYPKTYRCAAGVRTIGYGFTEEKYVSRGLISQSKATNILKSKYAECGAIVDRNVSVPLTQNQRAALISFAYNVGETNLKMLVNGKDRLNSGNYDSVPQKLVLYCRAGSKELEGLKLRREWEVQIWNGKFPTKYGNE